MFDNPDNPDTHLVVAPDVTLIRSLPGGGPVRVAINSLVITGDEPVLVDTGARTGRDGWWRQVEEVVDPADVRWIFLSHDDVDHHGNLAEALERCPDAVLVTSWLLCQRLAAAEVIPLHRCRWVNDGESFDAGGRQLLAVRPPAYDSPTTRGLFDATSGVYWASDCFGVPVPHPDRRRAAGLRAGGRHPVGHHRRPVGGACVRTSLGRSRAAASRTGGGPPAPDAPTSCRRGLSP